ncbi:MAG: Histidyl-tRNA synthetase [Candidatus Levybacteria bacterium GW2011_GWA2_37_36]|nr:MAG: Histidyl-tRNA synthetase [Candidatus Levybacteria bacterium GW2011_GWA2_37_36]OGH49853.1 MAG: histidine--tRNA ligase [Candidatus Levybacteria bacterium RIFCSPLOWO2_12_FULL_37_14]
MIKTQTLKGFRDFLPAEVKKRQYVINTLKKVFESYGFEPLETPALEYEEILLGKYGEEDDKLMYRFEDNGKRRVALRYDQTVPLARVVAQYQNELPIPFKRYQIQNVWRAENTQKGRYRELLQCDIDTVGASSPLADAEIIEVADKSLRMLGFRKYKIKVNDRKIFENIDLESIKILDKLEKIGPEKVEEELARINSKETLNKIENSKPLETTDAILKMLKNLGINENNYEFSPTLARGLDYYTGTIFEIKIEGYSGGSVGGGGRYDNLIGLFANRQIPAVGFAFGFDRLMEAMEEQNLFPANLNTTKVLVTVFSPELLDNSIRVCEILSQNNINQELYVDPNAKMEKQLKYADKKQIPYVVIIGPDEAKNNTVTVKNLKTREQKALPFDQFLDLFKE